jgi:hypothetical protein
MEESFVLAGRHHAIEIRARFVWFLGLAFSIVSVFGLSGCGSSSNGSTLTTPTATATLATDTFTGSVEQNGTAVYPFTVTSAG